MWLHTSLSDREMIRSTMLCDSPYLQTLAKRLEKRSDQLEKIRGIAESVNNSALWDSLQASGFEDIAQLFCSIEMLTSTKSD
jgi:hypothetical protein